MCSRRPTTCQPMWLLGLLLGLPQLGSGAPLHTSRSLMPAGNESSPGSQPASPSEAFPVTPTMPAPSSEAPALSLNLGLNFKIKVRSQGKSRPGEGTAGTPSARPAAPTHSQARGSRHLWAEALGSSGWPGPSPAADELSSEPGGWTWDGPSARGPRPDPWAPAPTPQRPLALWPRLVGKGPGVPSEEGESKELEFKIDIDLTAGLGKEGALAPNGSSPGRQYPLLPGLRVGIKEIASKLGAPGLFGSTLPPETWDLQEWNATGSSKEDQRPTAVSGVSGPGLESSSFSASPGSEGAFVALPGCLPARPEDCGSPLPEPGAPPLSSLLLPSLPLFVPLHSDWNTAQANWGRAWEAHIYGAAALFALLALLSLLGLLGLSCCCCRPAGCKLLALLHLLLAAAGGSRALLLLGDACGQLELFPDVAVRLTHDLALPCLTSAFAVAFLLLSLRARLKLSARPSLRHPCLLALLVLLHFSVATGAVLAADLLRLFPFLLLASRGLFALLAAGLSASFLVFYCLAPTEAAPVYDLKSHTPLADRCPFAEASLWQRAARTVLPSASFGLLSASLQAYAILHSLGYGLGGELFGPWPWWALQLACRLCEAGMGLPLACLGLYPLFCSPGQGCCPCCGRLLCLSPDHAAAAVTVKSQILPSHFQWALSQHEKLVVCDTITRSESDYLPLYSVPAEELGDPSVDPSGTDAPCLLGTLAGEDASDPTADFRPPSPIDLRRSIDEALCSEGLFRESSTLLSASSTFSFSLTQEPSSLGSNLSRTASCTELGATQSSRVDGEASLGTSGPNTTLSSPGPWRGSSSGRSSPSGPSTGAGSLALCPSPGMQSLPVKPVAHGSPPSSPPPPGHQYWVPTPVSQESLTSVGQQGQGTHTALLQEEFVDVCRQIDTLSVSSDTIDL